MNISNRTAHRSQSADLLTNFLKRFTTKNTLTLAFIIIMLAVTIGPPSASAATGRLSATPSTADIGNVLVGNEYSTTVRLNNSGTRSITFSKISVTGAGFSISGLTTPSRISAGASISFTVHYAPRTAGAAVGSVVITSNASNPTLTIGLGGKGVIGHLSTTPSSAAIGSAGVGGQYSQAITLKNTGTGNISFSHVAVSGAGFSVSGLSAPSKLPAGNSIILTVHFSPVTAGEVAGSLVITSDASNSIVRVGLSGTGVAETLSATPSRASFGSVVIGDSYSQTIRLNNTGRSGLTISRASISGVGFKIADFTAPRVIPAGGSTTFNALFAPTAAGSETGVVSLASSSSSAPFTIPLSGTAVVSTSLLRVSPTSLNFGTLNVNSDTSLGATLTNLGNSNVTISKVAISGAGFSQSGSAAAITLAPNQSTKLTIGFKPASAGVVRGNVTVTSNATNSPTTISLAGTATQQPAAKSVALDWTASTSSGVLGYNVYRGTTSGGPYTKITASAVAGTQYTDASVAGNHTYYYVVTSVDSDGVESGFSTQASVTIPAS